MKKIPNDRFLKIHLPRNSRKGFTLSETMITILIFGLLMGGCLFILTASFEAWRANSIKAEQGEELRKARDWITNDLILSGSSVVFTVPADGTWYNSITFKKITGITSGSITWDSNNTQYLLAGTNPVQLQRISGATTKIIAQNIETLQFRRQSTTPKMIEVTMNAKQSNLVNKWSQIETSLNFQIELRNP